MDCEPLYLASATSGTSWSDESQFLAGSWYLDPADRDRLSTPVGVIDTPCEPVDLVGATATNAVVLCTDGTLEIAADGGASWQETAPDVDARAVGMADGGYVLAGTHDTCPDGVAVSTIDDSGTAAEPTCAPVDTDADVAVTEVDDAVWLWADDEVTISLDGGQTW